MKPTNRAALSVLAPRICGAATALVGATSILGWLLWIPLLSGWLPVKLPMMPTTALLFAVLGSAVAGLPSALPAVRRWIALAAGGSVALFSALSLADLTFGWNIHFDRWFLADQMIRHGILNKIGMAPTSGVGFLLSGIGLVLLEGRGRIGPSIGQWAVVAALMVAMAALIGHFYEALGLYEVGRFLPMALPTATNFAFIATGVFALRPDVGFVAVLTAPNMGGVMARRLFGVVIFVPPLLGFVSLSLMRRFSLENAGGVGLLVTLTGLALAIAVIVSAHRLERTAEALTERSHELEVARLEADNANRAKSEFLANMSHELRTPLNAVIGFSEIMRDARFGPIDSRYREYSSDINDSGVHLLGVVNQILDLAKVESGQMTLFEEAVSLPDLADGCLIIVRQRAALAGISLVNRIPPGFPPLRGDEMRLRQVLINLLSNAVKFTRDGGTVTLDARLSEDRDIEITVADTGIGMTPQQLALAILPFRQIETGTSRRTEGTGLGLPLAKALVEQHGGTLTLESTPDVGTTARVRLPSYRLDSAADAGPRDAHLRG